MYGLHATKPSIVLVFPSLFTADFARRQFHFYSAKANEYTSIFALNVFCISLFRLAFSKTLQRNAFVKQLQTEKQSLNCAVLLDFLGGLSVLRY